MVGLTVSRTRRSLQNATESGESVVRTVTEEFLEGIVGALPRVLAALVFLALAAVVIKVLVAAVRWTLGRVYPADQQLVVDLLVTVVGVFLWFGAALALLKIVGMGDVAAGLGTATGFVALGVAFALKEMIADTVAGIYLLRDPDFEEGDRVETASVTGRIVAIGLRKTRIRDEAGNLVVLANRDVEKKWTRTAVGDEPTAGGTG